MRKGHLPAEALEMIALATSSAEAKVNKDRAAEPRREKRMDVFILKEAWREPADGNYEWTTKFELRTEEVYVQRREKHIAWDK